MTRDGIAPAGRPHHDLAFDSYEEHSSARRVHTETILTQTLRAQYPNLHLTVAVAGRTPLFGFASAGHASCVPVDKEGSKEINHKVDIFLPPSRRLNGEQGRLAEINSFRKFLYIHGDDLTHYILYYVDGRDGSGAYPQESMFYILSPDEQKTYDLLVAAGRWGNELHNEIWVFDGGFWQKSRELWESVQKSSWKDVILDEDQKKALVAETNNFFDSRDTYEKLQVPWKRGVIYYGPPGNGKTVSIKAMMHMLQQREEPIPTLYVRTLASWQGPEGALNMIFQKARQFAPCYLVLEDLETIVTPATRSYFLNQVDGLESNDGLFIVGSTNYIEKLDPGITKRPSRFDRKWNFPPPNFDQRKKYCEHWQEKLDDNDSIEFPDRLCDAIAGITQKFSFAYIQEAFVASLLAIASRMGGDVAKQEADGDGDLNKLVLWQEMQKQVKILRDEIEGDGNQEVLAAQDRELPLLAAALEELSVSTNQPRSPGNFHLSSRNIRLEGSARLVADCSNRARTFSTSRIDLDQHIANENGRLKWAPNGNFSKSARNITLRNDGRVLEAMTCDTQGIWRRAEIQLDACITNFDGCLRLQT